MGLVSQVANQQIEKRYARERFKVLEKVGVYKII
jgi:hypothetical protein